MRKIGVLFLSLVIALAGIGVGYASWSDSITVEGIANSGDVGDCFRNVSCTEWPEAKDVGQCSAILLYDAHTIQVYLNDAYPGYGCTVDFEVVNSETIPVNIFSIVITPDNFTLGNEISLDVLQIYEGQQIDPGQFVPGQLQVGVNQPAAQNTTYTFLVTILVAQWMPGGTIGFWKNWDRHNYYTESEINGWLADIDAASQWLVADMDNDSDIDVDDMEAILAGHNGKGNTIEQRFLAQYLATRLDVETFRIDPGAHDFSAYDPDDYLGLGGNAKMADIIQAIESKYGTSPTSDEYKVMHGICDALNNVEI